MSKELDGIIQILSVFNRLLNTVLVIGTFLLIHQVSMDEMPWTKVYMH